MMPEKIMLWLDEQIERIRKNPESAESAMGAAQAYLLTKEKIYDILADEAALPKEGIIVDGEPMSLHDRIRRDQALSCNRDDPGSLANAIRGLQSTDHPSLVSLHDQLMQRYNELTEGKK